MLLMINQTWELYHKPDIQKRLVLFYLYILKNRLQNHKSYDTITKLFRDYNYYILK